MSYVNETDNYWYLIQLTLNNINNNKTSGLSQNKQ